jgi:NAD(P)-dependent dehydrogenase (short-subunit alcohol dehydrogenase family)
MLTAILHGETQGLFASVAGTLDSAGFRLLAAPPATLLVNLATDADAAIARATALFEATAPGQEALVINMLHAHAPDDWQATRAAATLWAFTRYAALAWAPRRVRVNAIGLGLSPAAPGQPAEESGRAAGAAHAPPATPADLAATILAIWRFPSMTGQLIRLAA